MSAGTDALADVIAEQRALVAEWRPAPGQIRARLNEELAKVPAFQAQDRQRLGAIDLLRDTALALLADAAMPPEYANPCTGEDCEGDPSHPIGNHHSVNVGARELLALVRAIEATKHGRYTPP